jgi:signal transduction histidine kinase
LGTGKIRLNKEYFEVSDFIQKALETFSILIEEKELTVKRSIPAGERLFADRSRLLQAVNNLLANAFKYAKKGSEVSISFVTREDHITCTVSNLKDDLDSTADKTIYKSIGYGLDIVNDILQLHGTELRLHDEHSDRHTVSFDLPTETQTF